MTALNLNNLRCFLTVVETGSISRAAKEGFVTQQAVSEQIRRLEQDFQTLLLERTRPVRLPAGRFCGPGRVNAAGLADMDLVLYRCSAGLEAAVLPEHYARMAFAGSGDVCIFPIVPEIAAFQVGVGVWRERPVSTAARAFIRLAREELAGM